MSINFKSDDELFEVSPYHNGALFEIRSEEETILDEEEIERLIIVLQNIIDK
jgi:hypothetical protein